MLRRVTFDLTGLPPTLAEIDAFLADRLRRMPTTAWSTNCWLRRGLASEWRSIGSIDRRGYADTYGYQADVYRATWPWRRLGRAVVQRQFTPTTSSSPGNWLAGDLVPQPSRSQVLATAFNRHHRQTNEGGSIEEEFRVEYVSDRTKHHSRRRSWASRSSVRPLHHSSTSTILITHNEEYYRLFSFFSFNSIDESGLYSHFTSRGADSRRCWLTTADLDRAIAASERKSEVGGEVELEGLASRAPWCVPRPRLASPGREPAVTGLIGDFPLGVDRESRQIANRAAPSRPGHASEGPRSP